MADEREQQIRERLEATKRCFQSNGFGLSREDYAQWIKDGAAAFALHRDGADDLAYLLDALAAAREAHRDAAAVTVTPLREYYYELRAVQAEPCRVYWGSHGCDRPRGHHGPHICDCGQFPYGWDEPDEMQANFFGEDVELAAVIGLVDALEWEFEP